MKRQPLIDARESIPELSQQDMADMLGISRTFYNQIECGVRNPSLSLALEISSLLGVPVERLFKIDAPGDLDTTGTDG